MPVPSKFARIEDASPEAITRLLDRLDTLLQHLPSTLPFKDSTESSFRTFINFQLDKAQVEELDDPCCVLSNTLKDVFGWKTRSGSDGGDGIVRVPEQGPGVLAMVKVLRQFLINHPDNAILRKWILDITTGTENVYSEHKTELPANDPRPSNNSDDSAPKRPRSLSLEFVEERITKRTNTGKQIKRAVRGRPCDPLMARLTVKMPSPSPRSDSSGLAKVNWACTAVEHCGHLRAGFPNLDRVLKHAANCTALAKHYPDLHREAIQASKEESLGYQLEQANQTSTSSSSSTPTPSSSPSPQPGPSTPHSASGQSTLDLSALRAAGRKQKSQEKAQFEL
ncbi:hypothetical protein HGRIS_008480 [Hohenbuehelia grisea]|uniref:Uncharacterized protein n=1 Tax=Hohenbuehelia grisea TaxID=104357 RepID=A0ABR3J829_9AGAR